MWPGKKLRLLREFLDLEDAALPIGSLAIMDKSLKLSEIPPLHVCPETNNACLTRLLNENVK